MANIIRGKNQDTKTDTNVADLGQTGFGSKAAIAALQTQQIKRSTPEQRAARKADRRANQTVEQREKASLRLQAAGRTVTGAVARTNRQATQAPRNQASSKVDDAWEDPTEVSQKDDIETALQKRLQRAQEEESRIESQIDGGDPVVELDKADGLNAASQPIRDYGNYGALNDNPELLVVMGGLSETFDSLLQQNGIDLQNPAGLSDAQLQEIFSTFNIKKKKALSEEEEEAELILAGAVGILAIPRIQEKLEELGLEPEQAKSFQGLLKNLLDKVQQDDSPYNYLYKMIKEETEYSIVPEESDTVSE